MTQRNVLLGLICAAGLASGASGQVIISEIFANPNNGDYPGEWVEIYNPADFPVDISGWYLDDEDGGTGSPFPDGFVIEPGEAIVMTWSFIGQFNPAGTQPDDEGAIWFDEEDFYTSWGHLNAAGQPYRVFVYHDAFTIANTPTATNEVLTLRNAGGAIMDEANFLNNVQGWPAVIAGKSIYVAKDFLDEFSNDVGCAWRLSTPGIDGVSVSGTSPALVRPDGTTVAGYPADNHASPGYVEVGTGKFMDCNGNGISDALDICSGFSQDCNGNGIPDECEPDCNGNGLVDECEIRVNPFLDTNLNGILDSCEIALDPSLDQNGNGLLDSYEAFAGRVIITEIQFDPFTSGEEMEYVEIYNTTGGPIDISGFHLRDIEPGGDPATEPVPAGTVLPAGGIAVLTRRLDGISAEETRQTYIEAWGAATPAGAPILWIPLGNWGARATNATEFAEILTLVSGQNTIVDIANFINRTSNNEPLPGGWPGSDGHGSYYLDGSKLTAQDNDIGTNWRLSIEGLSGVIRSNEFDPANPPAGVNPDSGGEDYGTPGWIHAGSPQEPDGRVIITEIMATTNAVFPGYSPLDPNAPGGVDEWVEIYNTTNGPIDISGWYLQDEDGRTTGIAPGSVLQAGEVAVIIGGDHPADVPNPVQAFYDAWGCGYQVFVVNNWYTDDGYYGLQRLANAPNFINEILRIVDANGTPTDIVNYDDDGFVWPVDASGVPTDDAWSIYLFGLSNFNSVANDSGLNWADSLAPIDGARILTPNNVYNGLGFVFGSPGHLEGVQTPNLTDCRPTACSAADLAEPLGSLNFFDVAAFIQFYNAQDPRADLAAPIGVFNFFDVSTYIGLYNAGCP